MNYPLVSVVITTYNSEKALSKVLEAIKKQSYPKNKVEILIIDGGSTDKTLSIAKKYKSKILSNPKVDQVFGKLLGYNKAKGRFMLLLDSDEVMESKNSIRNKVLAMLNDGRVKAAISTGLAKPDSYPDINLYLNEFGDPFSYFMYRNSKDAAFFLNQLKNSFEEVYEDKEKAVFDFTTASEPPFIKLTAMAVMVDRDYIKKNFPKIFIDAPEHTHLFYLLNLRNNLFAIMKHDKIIHYSVTAFGGYLRKIRSRITSNIFGTGMGKAGFKGRETYHSGWYKLKKYLFIVYSISIVLPILDSIYLSLKRKKIIYLLHSFLTYYTMTLIVLFYLRKLLGLNTKLYKYGEK